MKGFLEKIKLIDQFTTKIPLTEYEFTKRLTLIIEEGEVGSFPNLTDIFSSSKKVYKGKVGLNTFTLKKRRRFFDTHIGSAIARGNFRYRNNGLFIETEINGFSKMMVPFFILIILFYLLFIVSFFFFDDSFSIVNLIFIPFLLAHAVFMLSIPYYMMRRSVGHLKYDLEREFFYLTNENSMDIN